jgi:hypothetical protein
MARNSFFFKDKRVGVEARCQAADLSVVKPSQRHPQIAR